MGLIGSLYWIHFNKKLGMDEIWKDVEGFEGCYQVSSSGVIKSLFRLVNGKNGGMRPVSERILKQKITVYGYREVALCENRAYTYLKVHRLVAMAFIPNPENKPEVNHKDGNKLNNNFSNLEWCTSSENSIHSYANGLQKPTWLNKKGKDNFFSKPILQLDLNGNVISRFECTREAGLIIGGCGSHISACANGKRKTAGGFKWKYEIIKN